MPRDAVAPLRDAKVGRGETEQRLRQPRCVLSFPLDQAHALFAMRDRGLEIARALEPLAQGKTNGESLLERRVLLQGGEARLHLVDEAGREVRVGLEVCSVLVIRPQGALTRRRARWQRIQNDRLGVRATTLVDVALLRREEEVERDHGDLGFEAHRFELDEGGLDDRTPPRAPGCRADSC